MKLQKPKHVNSIIIISLFYIAFFANSSAQTVAYTYDNNGNRTSQSLYVSHAPVKHHNNDSTKNDSMLVLKHGISVYPNPTIAQVNVAISSLQPCGSALVYLMDGSGNALSSQTATSSPVRLNLASYNQGIYYVKIVVCGDQVSYKVIKTSPGLGTPSTAKPPVEK